jgi:hypothetical protein
MNFCRYLHLILVFRCTRAFIHITRKTWLDMQAQVFKSGVNQMPHKFSERVFEIECPRLHQALSARAMAVLTSVNARSCPERPFGSNVLPFAML